MTQPSPLLLDQLKQEWVRFTDADEIPIAIHPLAAFALISQVQLALRHPQNTGWNASEAENLARTLQTIFPPDSAFYKVLEMGWSSQFDVEITTTSSSTDLKF